MDGINKSLNLEVNDYRTLVTSVKAHIKHFELTLKGYRWSGIADKYVPTGDVLCGQDTINSAIGLLSPFTHESNLITIKGYQEFCKQKYFVSRTFIRSCMNQMGAKSENLGRLFEIFYQTLTNVGDIILGSKSVIKDMLIKPEEDKGVVY